MHAMMLLQLDERAS